MIRCARCITGAPTAAQGTGRENAATDPTTALRQSPHQECLFALLRMASQRAVGEPGLVVTVDHGDHFTWRRDHDRPHTDGQS